MKTMNKCLEDMYYPLSVMEDILAKFQDDETFVVLDLNQADQQLKLDKESLFQNLQLPFVLPCSPFIFQKYMDCTLAEFNFAQTFLDHVIISGKGVQECVNDTCTVLDKFRRLNIKVKLLKRKSLILSKRG